MNVWRRVLNLISNISQNTCTIATTTSSNRKWSILSISTLLVARISYTRHRVLLRPLEVKLVLISQMQPANSSMLIMDRACFLQRVTVRISNINIIWISLHPHRNCKLQPIKIPSSSNSSSSRVLSRVAIRYLNSSRLVTKTLNRLVWRQVRVEWIHRFLCKRQARAKLPLQFHSRSHPRQWLHSSNSRLLSNQQTRLQHQRHNL